MRLGIKNFRSIQDQEVELAPITLLYGANGSGKSSLIYALHTLKNIVLNSNRKPDEFFNYTFLNLGNFDAVVFDHYPQHRIELGITVPGKDQTVTYQIAFGKDDGIFNLLIDNEIAQARLELPVSFPYPANSTTAQSIVLRDHLFNINWNGIAAQVQIEDAAPSLQEDAKRLAVLANTPVEILRKVGMVPLQRGFFKAYYSAVPVSPTITTEDDVATLLSNNKYLVSKVSHYLEQILERDFRLNFQPGTALFSLDAMDRTTGISSELVNEGFGVNQLVHFLARSLYHDTEWMCVEEPEIHLHPTALRRLARAILNITHQEGRKFLISTHSESFLLAFLALVAKGELRPIDLACYWVQKDRKATRFERQVVSEVGQIEGGLSSFMEGEMEDMMTFFQSGK